MSELKSLWDQPISILRMTQQAARSKVITINQLDELDKRSSKEKTLADLHEEVKTNRGEIRWLANLIHDMAAAVEAIHLEGVKAAAGQVC
jgi:hypothetical protein